MKEEEKKDKLQISIPLTNIWCKKKKRSKKITRLPQLKFICSSGLIKGFSIHHAVDITLAD